MAAPQQGPQPALTSLCVTHRTAGLGGRQGLLAARGGWLPELLCPHGQNPAEGEEAGPASLKRAPGLAGSEVTLSCPSLGARTQVTSLFCAGPSSRLSAAFTGCSTQAGRESVNSWTDAVCGPQYLKNTVEWGHLKHVFKKTQEV